MKDEDIKKISQAFKITEEAIREALARGLKEKPKKDDKSHFLFLPEDIEALEKRIEDLHNEILRLGTAIGLSCDVSGETFHDNFDYEECSRQQSMWSAEIKKLTDLRGRAKIINPADIDKKKVGIGTVVKMDRDGHPLKIRVGSYMTFSHKSASYESPIVKLILGAKVGETREGVIGDKKTKIRIISIE